MFKRFIFQIISIFLGLHAFATHPSIHIRMSSTPVANFTYSKTCLGDSTHFNDISSITGGIIVNRKWNFGDGSETWSLTSPLHRFANTGSYTITLTIFADDGATNVFSSIIEIKALPEPKISATPDSVITAGETTVLALDQNYSEYLWSNDATTPSIEVIKNELFWVKIKDSNGCIGSDSIQIVVVSEENPISPLNNIVTPNNDGINDFFEIKNINNPDIYPYPFKVVIYNIWGNKIYETSQYQNEWNGLDNDAGTYYYLIQTANKKDKKGSINVLH